MFPNWLKSDLGKISALFLVWRLTLGIFGFLALMLMPKVVAGELVFGSSGFWQSWANWDGGHFLGIAENGFAVTQQYAFFPLYPALISLLVPVFRNFLATGLVISNILALLAVIFLYKLAKLDFAKDLSLRTIIYFLFFPTAFFLGAVYSESLFIFTTAAAFYFLRKGNFAVSSIFAIFVTLTKPYGIIIVLPLVIEYLVSKKSRFKFEPQLVLLLVPVVAFIVYLIYLRNLTGDAVIFAKVQGDWLRTPVNPAVTLWNYYLSFFITPPNLFFGIQVIEFLSAILVLVLIIFGWKKLRLSYSVFLLSLYLIFVSTGTLTSFPRFVLVLWPSFFILANFGENFLFDFFYKLASLVLLGLFTSLFLSGFFIS